MASIINSNLVTLRVNEEVIAHSTSIDLSISNGVQSATLRESNGWREVISGVKTFSVNFEGLSFTSNLFVDYPGEVAVRVLFNNYSLVGRGVITSLNWSGEVDSVVTYSGTLEGTGELSTVIPTIKASICFGEDTICFGSDQIDGPLIQL